MMIRIWIKIENINFKSYSSYNIEYTIMSDPYKYRRQYKRHEILNNYWSEYIPERKYISEDIKSICIHSNNEFSSLEKFVSLEQLIISSFYSGELPEFPSSLTDLIIHENIGIKNYDLPSNLEYLDLFVITHRLKLPNSLRIFRTTLQHCILSDILPKSLNTLVNIVSNISDHNAKIILKHYTITYYEDSGYALARDVAINGIIIKHTDNNRHNRELKDSGLMDFI